MRGPGTLINVACVAAGGVLGLFVGDRLSESLRRTIMQSLGLVTLAVAIVGMQPLFDDGGGLRRFVVLIVSMLLGAVVGELARLEDRLENAAEALRARLMRRQESSGRANGTDRARFVDGYFVASTVFCVGPLTVLGAVEDGLGISIRLLAIKSALDGVASIGFASVYGVGVVASIITLVVYQGLLTAAAAVVEPLLTAEILAQLGATGSLLILGISFRLLDIARIRLVNLLPSLAIGMIVAGLVERAGS